jgi:hypothetical protein
VCVLYVATKPLEKEHVDITHPFITISELSDDCAFSFVLFADVRPFKPQVLIVPYCIELLAVLLAANPIDSSALATHPLVAFETLAQKITATGVKLSDTVEVYGELVGDVNEPTAVRNVIILYSYYPLNRCQCHHHHHHGGLVTFTVGLDTPVLLIGTTPSTHELLCAPPEAATEGAIALVLQWGLVACTHDLLTALVTSGTLLAVTQLGLLYPILI